MPGRILNETDNEVSIVHAYAFQISVNNPEIVEITRAQHDPRELQVVEDADDWVTVKE